MTTSDSPATREYHERTKHHPGASNGPRRIDRGLIPKQYKRYVNLPSVALLPPARSGATTFDVPAQADEPAQPLTLERLAAVLHYSAGIVRRSTVAGRELAFRAASCTGALYHIELYLVCGDIDGLDGGLYHYDVPSDCLRLMRRGDYRRALADVCCDDAIETEAASVVLTSTFWRNAWRYEERAYRHVFWDAGTLLANLLTVSEAHRLQPRLFSTFVDHGLNQLLGVDARREAAVAVVSLGAETPTGTPTTQTPLTLTTEPLSRAEIEYPLIWQTHAATSPPDCDAVQAWRAAAAREGRPSGVPRPSPRDALPLEATIERRGSGRRFSDAPLARAALDDVLAATRSRCRSDHTRAGSLVEPLLILNHVDGLESGAYRIDAQGHPSLIRAGHFAAQATHLALDQAAAGSAAANLYFVANAGDVAALGERGYRAVQMEAGILTGQAYLAATALGLKVTGLTFYDDEVARFFALDPGEVLVLMLVVFGR